MNPEATGHASGGATIHAPGESGGSTDGTLGILDGYHDRLNGNGTAGSPFTEVSPPAPAESPRARRVGRGAGMAASLAGSGTALTIVHLPLVFGRCPTGALEVVNATGYPAVDPAESDPTAAEAVYLPDRQ